MIGLDTNVLVRYLAQDDRDQSRLARELIEGSLSADNPGFVSVVTLAELAWVMESCYGASRADLSGIIERMHRARQLRFQETDVTWQALRAFRAGKADFADCLIERLGHAQGCERTVTFDQAAAKGAGMQMLGR